MKIKVGENLSNEIIYGTIQIAHARHYKSPYQFRPVLVWWYHMVAVFLVCHNTHNVNAPQATTVCTANSASRRSTLVPDPDQVSKHSHSQTLSLG